MVATKSNMIPLGTKAHPFTLLDTRTGEIISFSNQTEGKGFLFAFICNHCPFVIHLKNHFPTLFNQWNKEGVKIYTISANDAVKYPDDSPQKMAMDAEEFKFETSKIELLDNGKLIKALKGKAISVDQNIEVEALKFEYNKDLDVLEMILDFDGEAVNSI